jgi:pimeloyl-ACP methyl ester carboxylesterase
MSPTPVVFIHGLWLHATSWSPWLELFREAGYNPIAPGWPGEPGTVAEAREHPEYVANIGINDITGHYADIIDGLDQPPVIIGHSYGGLIAEKLLGQGVGTAVVAIDPAQIKGRPPSASRPNTRSATRARKPHQSAQGSISQSEGVSVRVRQCRERGGVERAV